MVDPIVKVMLAYLEESAHSMYACVVVYFTVYGVHLSLFVLYTIQFYHRMIGSGRKLPSIAMFSVILLSFINATIDLAAEVAMLTITIQTALITGVSDGIQTRMPGLISERLVTPNSLSIWAMVAQPILNDSVVIWRAWVLYPRKRWIMTLPIFFLVCTIGTSLTFFVLTTGTSGFVATLEGKEVTLIYPIAISFSLATNLTSTFLIGFKLWSFSRSRPHVATRVSTSKSPTYHILTILVETGLIYCIFQIIYLIANFTLYPNDHLRWPYLIFRSFAGSLSEMYPALVVCLVHYRRTTADMNPYPQRRISDSSATCVS